MNAPRTATSTIVRLREWSRRRGILVKMLVQWWRAPWTTMAIYEALERNDEVCAALALPRDCPTYKLIARAQEYAAVYAKHGPLPNAKCTCSGPQIATGVHASTCPCVEDQS